MRIVTWNCNGAFRKKFYHLLSYNADILIIQECENPMESNDIHYKAWAENYLWVGDTKNKGVGIFAREDIALKKLNWINVHMGHAVKHFLPCSINDKFNVLAVWLHHNNSPNLNILANSGNICRLIKKI